jgi:hypothetical protein
LINVPQNLRSALHVGNDTTNVYDADAAQWYGESSGYYSRCGSFSYNLNIEKDNLIEMASLRFVYTDLYGLVENSYIDLTIRAVLEKNPTDTSSYLDLINRDTTVNFAKLTVDKSDFEGITSEVIDVTSIINELISQDFWEYGDKIIFTLYDEDGLTNDFIAIYQGLGVIQPSLVYFNFKEVNTEYLKPMFEKRHDFPQFDTAFYEEVKQNTRTIASNMMSPLQVHVFTFEQSEIRRRKQIISSIYTMHVRQIVEDRTVKFNLYAVKDFNIDVRSLDYNDVLNLELFDNYMNYEINTNDLTVYEYIYFDLTEMIQDIVNDSNWRTDRKITFILMPVTGTQNGFSRATAVNGNSTSHLITTFGARILNEYTSQKKQLPENIHFYKDRKETFYYELLKYDEEIEDYKVVDLLKNVSYASINHDFDRNVIGQLDLQITSQDMIDFEYLKDMIRPWIIINDEYYYCLGTYYLNSNNNSFGDGFINKNITCFDRLITLNDDKLEFSYVAEKDDNIIDLVKNLIETMGNGFNYNIPNSDANLTENLNYEIGRSKLFIINSLLNMANYKQLYCNAFGVFCSEEWNIDYNILFNFKNDFLGLYLPEFNYNINFSDIYNKVVININTALEGEENLISILTMEDLEMENHPFSYTNIGRYITKYIESEAVTQEYIDLRAKREMYKMLEIENSINFKHPFVGLPIYGDGFIFENDKIENIDNRCLINNFTYNLKAGSMYNTYMKGLIKHV